MAAAGANRMDIAEDTPELSFEEAQSLSLGAAKVFQPRTPITLKELFAGRWNQLTDESLGELIGGNFQASRPRMDRSGLSSAALP